MDNTEDTIDSRDVIARIEELETNLDPNQAAEDELDEDEIADLTEELRVLKALADEAGGSPDWPHGETLIRDDYFEAYAEEQAVSAGLISAEAEWPLYCIDWERAARDLQMDYFAVDFDGVTYWIHS